MSQPEKPIEQGSLNIVIGPLQGQQDSKQEANLATPQCSSGASSSSSIANMANNAANVPNGKALSNGKAPAPQAPSPLGQPPIPPVAPVPPLPSAAPPTPVVAIFTAQEVYRSLQATAESRIRTDYFQLAVMGMMAGVYLSFGFTFCAIGNGLTNQPLIGALCFPVGLLLIVICGADLYTGNTCSLFTANIEGKANLWHDIKHLFSAYFWNLVGALIIIGFERGGHVWRDRADYVHFYAHRKIILGWNEVVCRAVLANWLVNLALWQAATARDFFGKAVACWTPITCFVCCGFEHCVANMFIIPMSIYLPTTDKYPDHITWRDFIARNLIPATIGNWIGGAIMVGTFNACIYGVRIPRWKDALWDKTLGRVIKRLP